MKNAIVYRRIIGNTRLEQIEEIPIKEAVKKIACYFREPSRLLKSGEVIRTPWSFFCLQKDKLESLGK